LLKVFLEIVPFLLNSFHGNLARLSQLSTLSRELLHQGIYGSNHTQVQFTMHYARACNAIQTIHDNASQIFKCLVYLSPAVGMPAPGTVRLLAPCLQPAFPGTLLAGGGRVGGEMVKSTKEKEKKNFWCTKNLSLHRTLTLRALSSCCCIKESLRAARSLSAWSRSAAVRCTLRCTFCNSSCSSTS